MWGKQKNEWKLEKVSNFSSQISENTLLILILLLITAPNLVSRIRRFYIRSDTRCVIRWSCQPELLSSISQIYPANDDRLFTFVIVWLLFNRLENPKMNWYLQKNMEQQMLLCGTWYCIKKAIYHCNAIATAPAEESEKENVVWELVKQRPETYTKAGSREGRAAC